MGLRTGIGKQAVRAAAVGAEEAFNMVKGGGKEAVRAAAVLGAEEAFYMVKGGGEEGGKSCQLLLKYLKSLVKTCLKTDEVDKL